MMTFKVGDKVRAKIDNPNWASWVSKGDVGEVLEVGEYRGGNQYQVTRPNAHGYYYVAEENIEAVQDSISPRASLLREAESLITGDRNNQYGPPTQDFARTAEFWTTYLGDKLKTDEVLLAHDIAAMMTLLKLSRITWSADKRDSWADAAGYIGCGWECVVDENEVTDR